MNHKHLHFRPLFGLKNKRLIEWIKDVTFEKPGLVELYMMTKMAVRAYLFPIEKTRYFKRLEICEHCPVFNKARKACRNDQTGEGCGCYVPYKALAEVDCWLREEKGAPHGWGKKDL